MTYRPSPLILTAPYELAWLRFLRYRWAIGGTEKLSQLPKFTQIEVEGRGFKPRLSDPGACRLNSKLPILTTR